MSDNTNEIKANVDKAVEQFKESKAGKTVLGEDGKFDKEDIERLTEGAKTAVKNAVDKAKEILG